MSNMNRRDFLRLGGAGLAASSLAPIFNVRFMSQAVEAAMMGPGTPKRMLFIFLRGGNDAVGTVLPHGDPEYNITNRPTLYIDPATSLDIPGNTFCEFHPKLAKLMDLHNAGDLATIHQVSDAINLSRSHFNAQQYWENTTYPQDVSVEVGWLNRLLDTDPSLAGHQIPGASIASQLQTMFKGPLVVPQFRFLDDYDLGSSPEIPKLVGAAPNGMGAGSGLLGVYSRTPDSSTYDPEVRDNGVSMAASLEALENLMPHTPAPGATYPLFNGDVGDESDFQNGTARTFFEQCRDTMRLFLQTDCRVCGIDIGGWDTHSNQGQLEGNHPRRLNMIAHALRSMSLDLDAANLWNDTLIVVGTEFSRTSIENGSEGTDHGHGGVMWVAGGNVNGGTYNMSAGDWTGILNINNRYLGTATDFRAVYAEILTNHFGVLPTEVDSIMPGWNDLLAGGGGIVPAHYNYVGFLP